MHSRDTETKTSNPLFQGPSALCCPVPTVLGIGWIGHWLMHRPRPFPGPPVVARVDSFSKGADGSNPARGCCSVPGHLCFLLTRPPAYSLSEVRDFLSMVRYPGTVTPATNRGPTTGQSRPLSTARTEPLEQMARLLVKQPIAPDSVPQIIDLDMTWAPLQKQRRQLYQVWPVTAMTPEAGGPYTRHWVPIARHAKGVEEGDTQGVHVSVLSVGRYMNVRSLGRPKREEDTTLDVVVPPPLNLHSSNLQFEPSESSKRNTYPTYSQLGFSKVVSQHDSRYSSDIRITTF